MYGFAIDGIRYDIGNKLDFIKTNIIHGLSHHEIGKQLKAWLLEYTDRMKEEPGEAAESNKNV
jgi:UTP--glucose-1-phosphate uridylyltransferase